MVDSIPFAGRCILLDIEGTTSSVRFVYDKMFPYVREHLRSFLTSQWNDSQVQAAIGQIAVDVGYSDFSDWLDASSPQDPIDLVVTQVIQQMDQDRKWTGLKSLQGLIWKSAFQSGDLVSHVYPDVVPAINRWRESGFEVRIYSSGSVTAQKLFFGHTSQGDLLGLFSANYDTTVGSKREPGSYRKIAEDAGMQPNELLFVSDIAAELDAAHQAGLAIALTLRPENVPLSEQESAQSDYPTISDFSQIQLRSPA